MNRIVATFAIILGLVAMGSATKNDAQPLSDEGLREVYWDYFEVIYEYNTGANGNVIEDPRYKEFLDVVLKDKSVVERLNKALTPEKDPKIAARTETLWGVLLPETEIRKIYTEPEGLIQFNLDYTIAVSIPEPITIYTSHFKYKMVYVNAPISVRVSEFGEKIELPGFWIKTW